MHSVRQANWSICCCRFWWGVTGNICCQPVHVNWLYHLMYRYYSTLHVCTYVRMYAMDCSSFCVSTCVHGEHLPSSIHIVYMCVWTCECKYGVFDVACLCLPQCVAAMAEATVSRLWMRTGPGCTTVTAVIPTMVNTARTVGWSAHSIKDVMGAVFIYKFGDWKVVPGNMRTYISCTVDVNMQFAMSLYVQSCSFVFGHELLKVMCSPHITLSRCKVRRIRQCIL